VDGRTILPGYVLYAILKALLADVVDIPSTAKAYLREQYLNCRNYSDGEIYRYIRLYQKSGDEQGERRWRSRLSPSKTKALKQLQNQCHGSIASCLDELVQFPGLWNGFQLGSFPTILSLRCPEVSYDVHLVVLQRSLNE